MALGDFDIIMWGNLWKRDIVLSKCKTWENEVLKVMFSLLRLQSTYSRFASNSLVTCEKRLTPDVSANSREWQSEAMLTIGCSCPDR